MTLGKIALAGLLPLALLVSPAAAVTSKQKMETCKFGADNQKLTGKKRSAFLKNCMANRNDPRGAVMKPQSAAAPVPKPDDEQ
jgi:hypothetical protein